MPSPDIKIPRSLLSTLITALDKLSADIRRDRVLHDDTIAAADLAREAKDEWLKERVLG